MALGSTQNLAGLARVAYEAVGLSDFVSDNTRAESSYRDATRGMSDEAIRLELSQDKLRRELAKGPANYRAIARAELEVRRSEQQLRGENAHLERQFNETGRAADRMGRGMLAGSGALRGMGRNLAFASAGFLGGAGLVAGIKSAISSASNLEEQQNKTRVLFKESGQEVIDWSKTTATSMGIASDEALTYAGSVGAILNTTGVARRESAAMSQDIVQLAADMASFNNEDPSDMLDRIRSGLVGEAEPLRRFGVLLDEASVKNEAYRLGLAKSGDELTQGMKVQARYSLILKATGDQQGDYARTAEGLANSQRTLSALWREASILVGQALVPEYTKAVAAGRDWLASDKNRAELQRTVNQLAKDGAEVVHGLVDAMRLVKTVSEPVIDALGGVGSAVEKLTLLWVALKVKSLLGFGGTAAASKAAATSMIIDAERVDAAWTMATRARVMPVATVGGPGGYVGSRGGRVTGGGRGLWKALPLLTTNPALITAGVILATPNAAGAKEGDRRTQKAQLFGGAWGEEYPYLTNTAYYVTHGQGTPAQVKLIKSLGEPPWTEGQLASAERQAKRLAGGGGSGPHHLKPPPTAAGRRGGGGGGGGRGTFTFDQYTAQLQGIDERALDAQATPGSADDARVERARLALARRALRDLKLTVDQRMSVKQQRNAALAELARIEADEEQQAQAIRDKRAAAAKARRDRREKREAAEQKAEADHMEKVMKRAQAHYDRMAKLTKGTDFSTRAGLRAAALRYVDKTGKPKGAADEDKPLTKAEMQRMLVDFARGLKGTIDQFGSNFGEDAGDFGMGKGPGGTQLKLQTIELQRQTQIMENWAGALRSPATMYHRTELTGLLTGVGF